MRTPSVIQKEILTCETAWLRSRGRPELGPLNWRSRSLLAGVLAFVIVIGIASAGILLQPGNSRRVRDVILMIGDGMGVGHVTLAELSLSAGQRLSLDQFSYIGLVTTHSNNNLVTDSAAAATAMATGLKTDNGRIAVDPDGNNLTTVLEFARSLGKSTGLVTTTRITHATPAAFASHIEERTQEYEIAVQLMESSLDVLLGGGLSYFLPEGASEGTRSDGRNLIFEAESRGYRFLENRDQLLSSMGPQPTLGLFSSDHMAFERARDITLEPNLTEMTRVALGILSQNPMGFFLMVEGGRIDHASHSNDLENVTGEMIAFEAAIGVALEYTTINDDVLLIVTADHETGGLSVGPSPVGDNPDVFWTTFGHTGNMVPIYSEGSAGSLFSGRLDNTHVGKRLFDLLDSAKVSVSGERQASFPFLRLAIASTEVVPGRESINYLSLVAETIPSVINLGNA